MRTLGLTLLVAVALVSASGCHWHHHRRHHFDRTFNSQPANDHGGRSVTV
jgi:hypothetical protein